MILALHNLSSQLSSNRKSLSVIRQCTCDDTTAKTSRSKRAGHERVVRKHPHILTVFPCVSPTPSIDKALSWDTAYTNELSNHTTSFESPDEGTIWFSDANAEAKVLSFLDDLDTEGALHKEGASATSFLDVGTGNGHMLYAIREQGWKGRLVGVDYSAQSVELCQKILAQRSAVAEKRTESGEGKGQNDGEDVVEYGYLYFCEYVSRLLCINPYWEANAVDRYDIIYPAECPEVFPDDGFDVVLDKGTFDAISLSAETHTQDGNRIGEIYPSKVEQLVRTGGLFIVTSCNWTAEEVRAWFEGRRGSRLKYRHSIAYPMFKFGGHSGSKLCTLCFEKTC